MKDVRCATHAYIYNDINENLFYYRLDQITLKRQLLRYYIVVASRTHSLSLSISFSHLLLLFGILLIRLMTMMMATMMALVVESLFLLFEFISESDSMRIGLSQDFLCLLSFRRNDNAHFFVFHLNIFFVFYFCFHSNSTKTYFIFVKVNHIITFRFNCIHKYTYMIIFGNRHTRTV